VVTVSVPGQPVYQVVSLGEFIYSDEFTSLDAFIYSDEFMSLGEFIYSDEFMSFGEFIYSDEFTSSFFCMALLLLSKQ
jgi:hypothetical protein